MYATDLLAELNAEQRAVATFDGGPLRVLAGAGTGKTTTLSARVAWLVGRRHPAPSGSCCSRSPAAPPARWSAAAMPGWPGAADPAGRVARRHVPLRRPPHAAPARRPARPARGLLGARPGGRRRRDRPRARRAPRTCRHASAAFPRKSTLLDLYSRAVNTSTPVAEVVTTIAPWASDLVEPIGAVCRGYVARKRRSACSTSTTCCCTGAPALRDDLVGRSLGGMSTTCCVDEYQDVNALQVDTAAGAARARRPAHRGRRRRAGDLRASAPPTRGTSSTSTRFSRRAPPCC